MRLRQHKTVILVHGDGIDYMVRVLRLRSAPNSEPRSQDEITYITIERTNEVAEYDVYLDGYFLGSKRVY